MEKYLKVTSIYVESANGNKKLISACASSCYPCSPIGTEHVTNVKVAVAVTSNGLMGPRFTYVYLVTRQYLKKFCRLCLEMHEKNNLALLSFENCHGLCEPFFTTLH